MDVKWQVDQEYYRRSHCDIMRDYVNLVYGNAGFSTR